MPNKNRYQAYLKVKKFPHKGVFFLNVRMILFKKSLSPREKKTLLSLVKGYEDLNKTKKKYAEIHTHKLFTKKEILEMKSFFVKKFSKEKFYYKKVKIPYSPVGINTPASTHGGCTMHYDFYRSPIYPLSFSIKGCFNIKNSDISFPGFQILAPLKIKT